MSTTSKIGNSSLERAKFAFENVERVVKKHNSTQQSKFKSLVESLPMMIKSNGLAAAYAFIYSKRQKDEGYREVEIITSSWLVSQHLISPSDKKDLYMALKEIDNMTDYRRCTREILALFTWVKRYARGMINE